MSIELTIFMDHVFRSVEEPLKVGEDFHLVYASALVHRVVQNSKPLDWIVNLKDGDGNSIDLTGATISFRAKGILKVNGSNPTISKTLTITDAANGKAKIVWGNDFTVVGFYLSDFVLSQSGQIRISPKKLRLEVIEGQS